MSAVSAVLVKSTYQIGITRLLVGISFLKLTQSAYGLLHTKVNIPAFRGWGYFYKEKKEQMFLAERGK